MWSEAAGSYALTYVDFDDLISKVQIFWLQ